MHKLTAPIRVYHNPNHFDAYLGTSEPTIEGSLLVATVATDDLCEVFRLTNHITQNWMINDGVEVHNGDRHRSTSVGDLVQDANGTVLICAIAGWHTPEEYRAAAKYGERSLKEGKRS